MGGTVREKELQEHLEKGQFWWWAEKARSSRINYLRKAIWSKATKGSAHLPGIKYDLYMVKVFTELFQEAEKSTTEPFYLTWARALSKFLDTVPIFIVDQSRIVGYNGSAPHTITWSPVNSYVINDDLYNDRTGLIDDEDRPWLRQALDWWRPRTFQSRCERFLSRREKMNSGMALTSLGNAHLDGHQNPTPQFDWIFKGFNQIIKAIDERLAWAQEQIQEGPFNAPESLPLLQKIDTWRAMKIVMEASIRWAKRYSRLAKIIAENFEPEAQRKQELLRIAETCERVPAESPEHLWESLQFEHFYNMIRRYEMGDTAWPSRPDYWHWPYYKKDIIDEKNITREDAIDYLCEYQMRCYETTRSWSRLYREIMQGSPGPYVWTIGGTNPDDGSDACNDLTDAILEATRLTRVSDPTYGFRYHSKARIQTLRQVFECIRHGLGYPSIRHEDVLISAMMHWFKTPIKDARTWVHQACMSPTATTKRWIQPIRYGSVSVMGSKSMDLVMFNGWDPVTRMQAGPRTGDPIKFKTFEEFYNAWLEQLKYMEFEAIRIREKCRWVEMTDFARPFVSATFEECVETGENHALRKEGGSCWATQVVWTDMLDGLAAVKKLIYDDKKYTMAQLVEAIKANWEGYEEMRMEFVKAPKWGNDDDYCDRLIIKAYQDIAEEISKKTIEWSGAYWPVLPENVAVYVVGGLKLWAQPNGRRWGDTAYDGGCSPGAGLDKKGPTAVLRSIGKLDHVTMFRANLLNQRLSPAQLQGEKGFELWLNYIKTWYDLKINHVQFNMVDNETLLAAQKEPEKYPELMVRVAGYSAHFVELNKKTQDTIIARTVQRI